MEKKVLRNKSFKQVSYYKTGTGPALMLVHGFPANAQLWRHVWPELAASYTLILPEFFSANGEWMKEGITTMDMLADGFKDILDQEQITEVICIGHSMGGYMSLAFAEKYPQYLKGLCLVHSSGVGDDPQRKEGRQKTIKILEQGGKSPFLKKMVRALFPPDFSHTHPDIVYRQTEEALQVPDDSLIAFYRAIMERRDTTHVVREAGYPVQFIIGAQDTLASVHKELSGNNLTNINFVKVYKNCAHMSMLEAPQQLAYDLEEFVRFCYTMREVPITEPITMAIP
jgi:3-oxoadipate enol-lactonase